MVIQCPECQARFKMADEKAKNGVKVRCSRCQHVFPVQLAASEPAAAPPAVAAAPAPPAAGSTTAAGTFAAAAFDQTAPAADESLPFTDGPAGADTVRTEIGLDGFDLSSFSVDVDSPPADSTASADELDLGHFNVNSESPFTMAANDDEVSFDEESPATEFSFDQGESGSFDFPADQPETQDFSAPGETGDDFSFEGDTSLSFDAGEPDAPVGASDDFPAPQADAFSFGEISADAAFSFDSPPPTEVETAAPSWSADDGQNDGFDFNPGEPAGGGGEFDFSNLSFGDDTPATPAAPPLSPAVSEVLPPLPVAPAAPPSPPPAEERFPASAPEDDLFLAPPPPKKRALSGAFGIVIVLLLLLSGVAGYFFWQGGMPELSSLFAGLAGQKTTAAAGQIRLADLNGYFLDNAEAGQLFVIQGKAVNEYPDTRSAISVKGVLYNQAGQQLMQQTVFPGNRLDDNALRTHAFSKIEESMNNQFGDSLSNLNIAPGKTIPFTIVFRNLPAGLAEFTVEVTDSKPGGS